jgi:hypothetical protein
LSKLSVNGIAELDLISAPLTGESFIQNMKALSAMYRVDFVGYDWREWRNNLQVMLIDEGWSEKRFSETCKWVAKNTPFANLTAADFFKAPVKSLHPYSWVLSEIDKDRTAQKRMEGYRIDGVEGGLWRYADGTTLPFEKIYPFPTTRINREPVSLPVAEVKRGMPDDVRVALEQVLKNDSTRSGEMKSIGQIVKPKVEPLPAETEEYLRKADEAARKRLSNAE